MSEKQIDIVSMLVKFVLRHEKLVVVLSEGFIDVAKLIVPTLEKCAVMECNNPATVQHADMQIVMCDRHCASTIVNARKNNMNCNEEDPLIDVRNDISNDENWKDVDCAESIRRLTDYIKFVNSSTGPTIN